MAACGSFQHILDKPLQENFTLLESLPPCNQFEKPIQSVESSSFTETFGELQLKENGLKSSLSSLPLTSFLASSSSSHTVNLMKKSETPKLSRQDSFDTYPSCNKKSSVFSSLNPESLHLCTEGLGFESSDDVGDLENETEEWKQREEKVSFARYLAPREKSNGELKRLMSNEAVFPPPISSIGKNGKSGVCFRSYRQDGRFVLQQEMIPSQELFHACREDGRLKLQFVQQDDENIYESDDTCEGIEEYFTNDNMRETTFDDTEDKKNA